MDKHSYKTNTQKGVLIACEGISGSGKSESIAKIYNYLSKQNNVSRIVEWNSNEKIRRKLIKVLDNVKMINNSYISVYCSGSAFSLITLQG